MVAVALYILSLNGFDIWEAIDTALRLVSDVQLGNAGARHDERRLRLSRPAQRDVRQRRGARPAPTAGTARTHLRTGPGSGKRPCQWPCNRQRHRGAGLDRAAKADLDRLECLMSRDQVWKEEGLTIASLALRANMPETQLRRLINDCLGYRNFPSYVNGHRIAAAKTRLSDPAEARVSISTIAYDIGFASLGPFNRAFKEEAGVSPSEWRRNSLGVGSPIPEEA